MSLERRLQIFILLSAVYLHDIGTQMADVDLEKCPPLVPALQEAGFLQSETQPPFAPRVLDFLRQHRHWITYDWLMKADLAEGRDCFPATGLRAGSG